MAKKRSGNMLGSWAFLIGVILALVFGLLETLSPGVNFTSGAAWIFVFLGIIVGLLNVGGDEVQPFLMSGTVLVIVGALGQGILAVVPIFQVTLQTLTVLFVPATIVVALKNVFSLARH